MRQGQQSRRGRNRGRKPQNALSRNYESSGPDVKIRGTAVHVAEKYTSLARDAMSSGDSVAAENYLQHAEHYNRIILAAQAQNTGMPGMDHPNQMNGNRFGQSGGFDGDAGDEDGDAEGEDFVPHQRSFPERQPYNPNQPQPYIPQNAFPHVETPVQPVQQVGAAGHAAPVPFGTESFSPSDGGVQRRRRRRPGDHPNKGFNGRHSGPPAPVANGSAPNSDSAPDEAAS
jgi:hypothetical protein